MVRQSQYVAMWLLVLPVNLDTTTGDGSIHAYTVIFGKVHRHLFLLLFTSFLSKHQRELLFPDITLVRGFTFVCSWKGARSDHTGRRVSCVSHIALHVSRQTSPVFVCCVIYFIDWLGRYQDTLLSFLHRPACDGMYSNLFNVGSNTPTTTPTLEKSKITRLALAMTRRELLYYTIIYRNHVPITEDLPPSPL